MSKFIHKFYGAANEVVVYKDRITCYFPLEDRGYIFFNKGSYGDLFDKDMLNRAAFPIECFSYKYVVKLSKERFDLLQFSILTV